eukprot:m.4891 g.4891  ORF g.4891 m.4891 type:complete len:150 (+) comp4410_c0_seq1:3-452(+)
MYVCMYVHGLTSRFPSLHRTLPALSERLRGDAKTGPLIVAKGQHDLLANGKETFTVKATGSPRRVGGQGDILCGVLSAFTAWSQLALEAAQKGGAKEEKEPDHVAAAAIACTITKQASELAYAVHHRGMVASDMLSQVPRAFQQIVGHE